MADDLDPRTLLQLLRNGIDPSRIVPRKTDGGLPYNTAGLPSLQMYDVPQLTGTGTRGFMTGTNAFKDVDANRGQAQAVFLRPDAGPSTVAHEAEHLLARQNLGMAPAINSKFDELMGKDGARARSQFVKDAAGAADYLREKYGIKDAYFGPEIVRQGGTGLYEQLATLAGYEAANNVDLTKDPVLRKTLFKDKNIRETYNAITGLRQTRLDARDLPSYTRQPEKEESLGVADKLKKLMGLASGGMVPQAGNTKLI